ncbi:MAG: TetR/AcrR family transcriptional regulator, partial [Ralstonia sp.]|nr:TetR/AcrR family transcriptional regulator [Ralstonia sp.]
MPKPSLRIDEHDAAVDVDAESSAPAAPRAQLTPDDWVRAATDLLVTKSIDAVR